MHQRDKEPSLRFAPFFNRRYNLPTYEWDEAKRLTNFERHGVDFADAGAFEWDMALTVEDRRRAYDEERFVSISFIGTRLHVLVWTERGDRMRIISLRKANDREIRRYAEDK